MNRPSWLLEQLLSIKWDMRHVYAAGIGAAVGVVLLVLFSEGVHNWCAPQTAKFGGGAWGAGMYDRPSMHHCIRLVCPWWK
jgi:hypothetical protein